VLVMLYARHLFLVKRLVPPADDAPVSPFRKLVYGKFFVDEMYDRVFTKPFDRFSAFLQQQVDLRFLNGTINGLGKLITGTGQLARKLQNGNTGMYAIAFVFAILLLFILFI
jgi:NADH-quinone oxidoreductase subunit L